MFVFEFDLIACQYFVCMILFALIWLLIVCLPWLANLLFCTRTYIEYTAGYGYLTLNDVHK